MLLLQGGSSALVVNQQALPGKVPETLEIDVEGEVLPAQLAAQHAAKYPNNVHPVSPITAPTPSPPPTQCKLSSRDFEHARSSGTRQRVLPNPLPHVRYGTVQETQVALYLSFEHVQDLLDQISSRCDLQQKASLSRRAICCSALQTVTWAASLPSVIKSTLDVSCQVQLWVIWVALLLELHIAADTLQVLRFQSPLIALCSTHIEEPKVSRSCIN